MHIELLEHILEGLTQSLGYLANPEKRIYWAYLVTSAAMAYFVFCSKRIAGSVLEYLIPKKMWLSQSSGVDAVLWLINGLFKVFLIGPYFIFGFALSDWVEASLVDVLGYPSAPLSETATLIWYTVVLTLALDLSTYFVHLLMHRVPALWEFHKIHHAATVLTPITQYRIHPIELLVNNAKAISVMGVVTGVFSYLSPHHLTEMAVFGVNVFNFAFLFLGANLRHSHIEFKYPSWLENILISPFQHQIHHSENAAHFDKNLGSKFAIWDKLFGTLIQSKEVESISYGIGEENDKYRSIGENLYRPITNLVKRLRRTLNFSSEA